MKTIEKGSLGFVEGMSIGQAMPKYTGGMRQVDWDLVKTFIEDNKELLESVEAGLAEDWTYTSGEVWNEHDEYAKSAGNVYGASDWATPSIEVTYKNGIVQMLESWKLGDNAHDYFKN